MISLYQSSFNLGLNFYSQRPWFFVRVFVSTNVVLPASRTREWDLFSVYQVMGMQEGFLPFLHQGYTMILRQNCQNVFPLSPLPPWQQQMQSAGIQEMITCILSSNSKQGRHHITLVFLVLCFRGWSITSQSLKERAILQSNRFTVKRDWSSKSLGQTPKIPYVQEGINCPQSPFRSSYSASPPSQTVEELCSVNYWYVTVSPSPFILLYSPQHIYWVPWGPFLFWRGGPKRLDRSSCYHPGESRASSRCSCKLWSGSPLSLAPRCPLS